MRRRASLASAYRRRGSDDHRRKSSWCAQRAGLSSALPPIPAGPLCAAYDEADQPDREQDQRDDPEQVGSEADAPEDDDQKQDEKKRHHLLSPFSESLTLSIPL